MPKVSVIVPIYNVEKYLEKCINSLLSQTLEDIQIILVNDGSKDNSGNIAKEYEKNNKDRVIYVEKENGGLSDARNYGLKYATGDFIAFLDSDDYIEKNAYEEMYNKAIEENADYVECDFIWKFPNKIRVDKQYPYKNKKEMLSFVRVVAWNKLIKRQLITDNNLEFPKGLRYEDVEFTYKLIPFINKFAYVDKPFIHYVQREGSIANVQNERTAEIVTVLDNVIGFYKKNNIYEKYRDELEYNYARYLLCSSLKRMCKIKDKTIREKLLTESWERLNLNFPNWKENVILKTVNIGKNKYMRTVNKSTYKIYSKILEII
ncbi:MAG: glycosyl transferase family 2 [Clostridium sp.]|nr:MAG: glycosyl transferase family 2 [Clostridium sp.]